MRLFPFAGKPHAITDGADEGNRPKASRTSPAFRFKPSSLDQPRMDTKAHEWPAPSLRYLRWLLFPGRVETGGNRGNGASVPVSEVSHVFTSSRTSRSSCSNPAPPEPFRGQLRPWPPRGAEGANIGLTPAAAVTRFSRAFTRMASASVPSVGSCWPAGLEQEVTEATECEVRPSRSLRSHVINIFPHFPVFLFKPCAS
jgi:hypothetical protein